MYSFCKLSGHTLWTGPLLQKGIDLSFGIRVSGGGLRHGRFIDAAVTKNGQVFNLTPKWHIDLVKSGVHVFTGGQGLPGQLKNVMACITGFEVVLHQHGFTLAATLEEDETGEGLCWEYGAPEEKFDPKELFRPESLGGERKTLAFSEREAYPVMTTVSETAAA